MKNIRLLIGITVCVLFFVFNTPFIVFAEISAGDGSSNIVYCSSFDEAGAILRAAMTEHESTVTIGYRTNDISEDLTVLWNNVWAESFRHTGVSDEGDYLKFLISEYKGTIDLAVGDGTYAYTVVMKYEMSYYTTREQEMVVDDCIDDIIAKLDIDEKTDYQKIEAIYDYVCNNIYYDNGKLDDADYKLKYTAYAALTDHKAVCQGYVSVLYRLLLEAGIDNRIIPGVKINNNGTRENHVWNIVRLGDVYYNTDVTWDSELFGYDYYMKNDKVFNPTHIREDDYAKNSFCSQYPISETNCDYDSLSDKVTITDGLFTDDNFRQFVQNSVDKNGDGCLSRAERIAVRSIDISNQTVENLKGIELFDKLTYLKIDNAGLRSVDLSDNLNLLTLTIIGNQELHNLDIKNNFKLLTIVVEDSPIDSLDVNNNERLIRIDAFYCGLNEIDISNNYNLEYLKLEGNNISSIDVRHLKNLYIFNCQNNPISTVDVSYNSNLKQLVCQKCPLGEIDVSSNSLLESLWCSGIGADHLDVSNNPLLEQLFCGNNNIAGLDLSENDKLTDIRLSGNIVTIGDVSEFDMSLLPEFNPDRAGNWKGAEFDSVNNKIININSNYVTYDYDCGKGQTMLVTLQCISDGVGISASSFPDEVFREYISSSFDKDENGFLDISEINAVNDIRIKGLNVSDVTGIQIFPRLVWLDCSDCNVEELSGLSTHVLSTLKCDSCSNLKKIELDTQPNLGYLDFSNCSKLKILDISECGYAPYVGNEIICYVTSCKQLHTIIFPKKKVVNVEKQYFFYTLDTLENIVFTGDALDFGQNSFSGLKEINVCYPANNNTWTDDVKRDYAAYKIHWIESDKEAVLDAEKQLMSRYDGITVNEENFPDEVFRNFVLDNIDTNQDGELSYYEIDDVRELDISNRNIKSLVGIDYFLHLQKLKCMNNDISEFHCTSTHMLNEVVFSNNPNFKVFDVVSQPELSGYDFQGCSIENIDLSECGCWTRNGWPISCYFNYCSKLKTVVLPEDIRSFSCGSIDFRGCTELKCIVFTGHSPEFNSNSFKGLDNVIVCYPADDETWTDDVMVNYAAGNIEWIKGNLDTGLQIIQQREEEAERYANEIAVIVDENSFPDEVFREYVLNNFDSDKDGNLTNGEISKVKTISLNNVNARDLTGIDYFINLNELDCYYIDVENITLTSIHNLEIFNCVGNQQLKDIDVGIQPKMRWYSISSCKKLTELDFSNCGQESDVSAYWSVSSCDNLSIIIFSGGTRRFGISSDTFSNLNVDTFVFVGKAPSFSNDAFEGLNDLTVYYPPDDSTWKKENMNNYGANSVMWIAGSKEEMYEDKAEAERKEQERLEREKREADNIAAQRFVDAISDIGIIEELTLDDADSVAAVRQLYNGLTDDQKQLVSQNYVESLELAEGRIEELEREKAEEEAARAEEEARKKAEEQARKEKESSF